MLERLLRRALGAHVEWRRTLHAPGRAEGGAPTDVTPAEAELMPHLERLLSQLRGSVPFFSPRHLGHMASDVSLASLVGYIAGLLYNSNNVAVEAGPVTTQLEREAIGQMVEALGYPAERAWGHLTSGGTIANVEALWIARTARYLPIALRWTAEDERLATIHVRTARGELRALTALSLRELLNLPLSSTLALWEAVREALGSAASPDPRLLRHLFSELGMAAFASRVAERFGTLLPEEIILAPATAHYSWEKCLRLLGVGPAQLRSIAVDTRFRLDVAALEGALRDAAQRDQTVLACTPAVGSTEESAVDPLEEILTLRERVAREHGLWFWVHADASFGGYAATVLRDGPTRVEVSDEGEGALAPDVLESLRALANTDSLTVDPHKYGYAPFPAGAVLFRDGRVRALCDVDAPYALERGGRLESPGHFTLEGSRPGAAAASVWLAQRQLPLNRSGHGRLISASVAGARRLHRLLSEADWGAFRIALLPVPDLNIVCYAVGHPALSTLEETNAFGDALYEQLSLARGSQAGALPEFVVSRTLLRVERYPRAALPTVETLGFSAADFQRAGSVHVLRSAVMHPSHAASDASLRAFVHHLRAQLESLMQLARKIA